MLLQNLITRQLNYIRVPRVPFLLTYVYGNFIGIPIGVFIRCCNRKVRKLSAQGTLYVVICFCSVCYRKLVRFRQYGWGGCKPAEEANLCAAAALVLGVTGSVF